jgi:hypothetical protein
MAEPIGTPKIRNPKTGEVAELRDGRWQPVTPLSSTAPGYQFLPRSMGTSDPSEAAYFRKWRADDDVAQSAATKGLAAGRRMEQLMSTQEAQEGVGKGTGGWRGMSIAGVRGADINAPFDPEVQEMNALQSEFARSKRTPGEGAISDFDAQQFIAMSPGADKSPEANKGIIRATRMADDMVVQRRQFGEWYYSTFGSLTGAPEAWSRYAQSNPIFQVEKFREGRPLFNDKRQNWRQWFGAERGAADRQPTEQAQDAAPKTTKRLKYNPATGNLE